MMRRLSRTALAGGVIFVATLAAQIVVRVV